MYRFQYGTFSARFIGIICDKSFSASVDGTIIIWNTSNGTCIHSFEREHQQIIKTLAFSPDGKMFASGGYDRTIHVWKFEV